MHILSQAESYILCCKYQIIAGMSMKHFFKFLVYSDHYFRPGWGWEKQEACGIFIKREHIPDRRKMYNVLQGKKISQQKVN